MPDGATECPNCHAAAGPLGSVARGALAGTAALTLMACYGLPPSWSLSVDEGGPSQLLDASTPEVELSVELGVSQQAISDMYNEPEVEAHVVLTPLTPQAQVEVTTIFDGGEPVVQMHEFRRTDPRAFGFSSGGYDDGSTAMSTSFLECMEDRCTHQVSIAVVVLEGEVLMESEATMYVGGSSQDQPGGAEAWATWQ